MAKKSMIAKAKRTPKFKVRGYTAASSAAGRALHAPVRAVPHLLPGARPAGRAAGRDQVELVGPMNISDPIADMLTRIRNASRARHTEVVVPASRTKREIARILKDEGFIDDVREEQEGPRDVLRLTLKYVDGKVPVVSGLKRISKPGLRVYAAQDRHPARPRRPRHRHRQHQPGDHDRRAGPQGPARRRSPRVRLVGRRCHVSDACPSPSRPASTSTLDGRTITVKGPKGDAARATSIPTCSSAARTAGSSSSRPTSSKTHRQLHGLTRTLVANMVVGVTDGYRKGLEITGVGYRAAAGRREAPAQPGLQPPDRDRPARRASASRSRTRPASPSSASTRSSSARSPPGSARRASPSPTRARASATPARSIRRKAGKAGKIGGKK